MTLYRGITPSATGLDIHGGYGETWVRDFSSAVRYARPPHGYVLEAVLLPNAKQLVLTTEPDAEGFTDYVPEGIQELAQIIGDPWIYDSLLSGQKCFWEEWEPEWTEMCINAGYDSIFTGGFDGPEEYVLNASLLLFTRYYRILATDKIKAYPIKPGTLEKLGYVVGARNAVTKVLISHTKN